MRYLSDAEQIWLRSAKPKLMSWLTNLLFCGRNCKIGSDFRSDSLPRIIIDENAYLEIGKHVEFRRDVEIRVHGESKVIIKDGVRIDRGVRILATNSSVITIDSGARIGMYSVLNGGSSISVGVKSLVSGFVYLQTSMHKFDSVGKPIRDQGYDHAEVVVGDGAWLAAHVVVMPGIKIGDNAVVGSNAVVTSDVSANTVVGGVPAKTLSSNT